MKAGKLALLLTNSDKIPLQAFKGKGCPLTNRSIETHPSQILA
jgi:hypothetical protein